MANVEIKVQNSWGWEHSRESACMEQFSDVSGDESELVNVENPAVEPESTQQPVNKSGTVSNDWTSLFAELNEWFAGEEQHGNPSRSTDHVTSQEQPDTSQQSAGANKQSATTNPFPGAFDPG